MEINKFQHSLNSNNLMEDTQNSFETFCQRPDSKHLRLCKSHTVSVTSRSSPSKTTTLSLQALQKQTVG